MRRKSSAGFSLIELLIVISIIGFLSAVGLASYLNFNRSQILTQATEKVVSDLRLTQSLAANNQKPVSCSEDLKLSGYSFKVESTSAYGIFVNCGLEGEEILIKSGTIPLGLALSPLLGTIKFRILRQGVEFTGGAETLTLTGFGKGKTIVIDKGGAIKVLNE